MAGKKGRSGRKPGSKNKPKLGAIIHQVEGRDTQDSIREQQFVAAYVTNGNNGTQAVLTYKPHLKTASASVEASRMLKRPTVQRSIERVLIKAGVTDEFVAAKIREGMDAKKVVSATAPGGDAENVHLVEVPDYAAQHRFLETAVAIRGDKAPKKVEHEHHHSLEVHPFDLERFRLTPPAEDAEFEEVYGEEEEDEEQDG